MIIKIEKIVVLSIIYLLWLWWSTGTATILVKAQSDSLKPGDTTNNSFILYSKQGKYYLALTVLVGNTEDRYLSIFRSAGGRNNVVWVYDRNNPMKSDSVVLSLDYSGVLKIESQKNSIPKIIYSSPQPTNNTMATLLDTGNLVLQQLHPNGTKSILWQSFDYPTNTLIPTMKLGVNRKTEHNWSLISWLAPSLPNSGGFSLEWEPNEGELNIKQRSKVYWKSGKLKNNGIFENIPANVQHMYQYVIVSNKHEDSFTFKIKDQNYKMFPGWELFSTGMLTSTEGEIANADMCYGYNSDGGCQNWEDMPICREPGEVFQKKTGRPNTHSATIQDNGTYGYSDCKLSCWRNCDCNGFQEFYRNGTGCIFYSSNSTQDVDLEYPNIYNVMVKPTLNHHVNAGKNRWILIGAAVAAAILILCPLLLCVAKKKQKYALKDKKSKREENEMQDLEASHESFGNKDLEDDFKGHDIKVFNYASILEATLSFSPENKLGQGGYGPVYKGILPTGREIAVKRLSKTSGQGTVEFKNELVLICELQHTNLVQLLGCCIHEEERILIYEYMSNKSLDFYLFGENVLESIFVCDAF